MVDPSQHLRRGQAGGLRGPVHVGGADGEGGDLQQAPLRGIQARKLGFEEVGEIERGRTAGEVQETTPCPDV